MTDLLSLPLLGSWKDRDGLRHDTPGGAIYGRKTMLIDQDAGSGGDFMPYAFKRLGLGPLDRQAHMGRIANEGVAPDQDVALDPLQINEGRDAQLDAATAHVRGQLKDYRPLNRQQAPAMPTELGR